MTITSVGYDGSLNEAQWAKLAAHLGEAYAIAGDPDFKCSVGTGTLGVSVAAGTAFGRGVMDVNSAPINLNAGAISSGTRWDTVVITRNWAGTGGTTTCAIQPGTSAQALSTALNATPGTIDDQPIALIKCVSGFTAIQQFIDLRQTASKVRTYATTAALQLGTPAVGGFGYALDTGHMWHREQISGTPTWVDLDAPAWVTPTLAGDLQTSGAQGPQFVRMNGLTSLRGGLQKNDGTNFGIGGGTSGQYSLFTLPVGYRPGAPMVFEVAYSSSTAMQVRVVIDSATGAVTAIISGPTTTPASVVTALRLDGITFPAEN